MNPQNENFSQEEILRYSRHLVLPELGTEGQRRLKNGSVLLIGAGGLGSPAALYLAAAGVGRIGLVDFDRVDLSNLQRQILHTTARVGTSKLDSARATIEALNPHIKIETHETRLNAANAFDLIRNYDVILDGTDNFSTRYLDNVYRKELGGRPEKILLTDRVLLADIALYGLALLIIFFTR